MTSASTFGLVVAGTSGGQELILCPWHSDRRPSAWWNPRKNLFYCAVCNLGLNAWQLANRLGLELDLVQDEDREREPEEYSLISEVAIYHDLGSKDYHSYFAGRGITLETARFYDLGWDYIREAAALPITNLKGNVVGVQYRYENPKESGTRYKTVGETQPVWPMHHLSWLQGDSWVFIFEGAWSAMRFWQFFDNQGFRINSASLLGAKSNQKIVDTLTPFKPIILYDGDRAGREACRKMRRLAPHIHCWTLSKSVDDMDYREMNILYMKIMERV